eukprot:TRINITY_DN5186_c0_g1_i1.p1 TRINITY_DN5186_c0_g1~~TRINITY_DN5186_c0_g1_i1.p1  ORF type:complete len:606 (-),score=146.14 TRINITY_DN5186_c0_g1_i1:89-1666(-)
MEQRKLEADFNEQTEQELASIVENYDKPNTDEKLYKDLRDLPWVSIDNDDTRDIDQITAAQLLSDGKLKVWIAVADCDYYVKAGGPIDKHAYNNTTSVYTPSIVFTMLPVKLSYELTSLNHNVDRKAFVIEILFENRTSGNIVSEEVYLGTVRNKAKLAYPSISKWLDGEAEAPIALSSAPDAEVLMNAIKLQDEIASVLLEKRREVGALEFQRNEPRCIFEGDDIQDIVSEDQNRAQRLIENLMVAANGVTSRYLRKHKFSSLQRVVREPERWEQIVTFVKKYNYDLPSTPSSLSLRHFLAQRRSIEPETFQDLSLTIIKLMGRGEYIFTPANEEGDGHFGLAVQDYTHSTAPNRRYPDMITHRLIRAVLKKEKTPYSDEELEEIAKRCTEMQDLAAKVERQVSKSAAALLLADKIGEKFNGIVTGSSKKGCYVRLTDIPVEGRLLNGSNELNVGERVYVELVSTDAKRGFIDFKLDKDDEKSNATDEVKNVEVTKKDHHHPHHEKDHHTHHNDEKKHQHEKKH